MSHTTAALVAAFQAAPEVPAGSNERIGVDWVRTAATRALADLTPAQIGDALMHFVSLLDGVIDAIGDADRMLDWESRTHIARNILGVAGMELYVGARTDSPDSNDTTTTGA